jgi:uncharacterized protein
MRVVLDTGIFLSAFLSTEGYPRKAVNLWLDKEFQLITSEWQIEEIKRVSQYDRLKKRITPRDIGFLINNLKRRATVLKDIPRVVYSRDPDDNPIIATALAGKAQYLVSGDKRDLLDLGVVAGVRILTAREFVELFETPEQ